MTYRLTAGQLRDLADIYERVDIFSSARLLRDEAARREAESKRTGPETYDKALDMLADAPPPTAPDDLLKRLRSPMRHYAATADLCNEAADAIEALRADLRHVIAERDKTFATMLARAEAAEAREKRLREALEGLLDAVDAHNKANGKQMIDPHAEQNARNAHAQGGPREVISYTKNQPSNDQAYQIYLAFMQAKPGGDFIDHGLAITQQLEMRGYGLIKLAARPNNGGTDDQGK